MASYLRFESEHGDFLVETEAVTVAEPGPAVEQPAGLGSWTRNRAGEVVMVAQTSFEEAVKRAVALNVSPLLAAADALPDKPAELEITFGLKGTGEVGNVAVGKVAAECTYQVKMVWRRDTHGGE